jgi:three-Cys-motif partner protein
MCGWHAAWSAIKSIGAGRRRLCDVNSAIMSSPCISATSHRNAAGRIVRSQIRGTGRIVGASPLLILGMPEAYDKYIFCEQDKNYAEALETRCRRDFLNRNVKIITGNANASLENIIAAIPQPGRSQKVLGFCFLDPFQLQNLQFSTIETLSQRFMDFLVLIPSSMDANRNEHNYI